jgi:hypothetical protein
MSAADQAVIGYRATGPEIDRLTARSAAEVLDRPKIDDVAGAAQGLNTGMVG